MTHRTRSPGGRRRGVAVPVLLAVLSVVSVMSVRLLVPCHGDPGCFVVAGARFTDPVESGLPVASGPGDAGYDGQFFWRLSRSPDELGLPRVHGVVLDTPVRAGRPAYPAVVWAVSGGGREHVVDWMMIVVNLTSTGVLSLLLAVTARRHGVSPWVGALAALWPGLLFAVGRDLAEPGSALLVVCGLAAVGRGRPGVAGLAWAGAVLWREQALVVPAAYGCWWLLTLLRRPGSAVSAGALSARAISAWAAPLTVFLAWQAVAARAVGDVPLLDSGAKNVVVPLTGLLPEATAWVQGHDGIAGLVWLVELVVALAIVTAAVVLGLRDRRWEVVAVIAGLLLVLSASRNVWGGPAHLRYATDLVATAWFVLVSPRRQEDDSPSGVLAPARPRSSPRWARLSGGLIAAQMAAAALAASYLVRTL